MGRPLKKGLNYFNVDCIQQDNLNYIEAKHGLPGYGIVVKLWRKIYMVDGYFCEWTDKNLYLFSREINVEPAMIKSVVEDCFEEGIFSRQMYQDHCILTSSGIQKRYIKIVTEAKRKDCEIDGKYLLIGLTQEKNRFPPEETTKTPEESTQRDKRKGSKGRKLKEDTSSEKLRVKESSSAPANAAPPGPAKAPVEEKEPYWQFLVKGWFDFGKEKFKEEPSFERDDPKIFKRIIHRLKRRAASKGADWNEETSLRRLRYFLDSAFEDEWLSKNFLLSNLEKQFDKIIQRQAEVGKLGSTGSRDLQYLYERYRDGKLDMKLITTDHFEQLDKKSLVKINGTTVQRRIRSLMGGNIKSETELWLDYEAGRETEAVLKDRPTLMRIAVIEYFKTRKDKNESNVY